MEETVRTLLQYKSKFEQLKQDRHSVANSYEVSQKYGRILTIDIHTYTCVYMILSFYNRFVLYIKFLNLDQFNTIILTFNQFVDNNFKKNKKLYVRTIAYN